MTVLCENMVQSILLKKTLIFVKKLINLSVSKCLPFVIRWDRKSIMSDEYRLPHRRGINGAVCK